MATARDQIALPAEPRSVTLARRFARTALVNWGLDELVDDAQLGVCELVANAVRHTDRDIAIALVLGDELVIEVYDANTDTSLSAGAPPVTSTSGRGLQIVEAISSDWGVTGRTGGKTVWFSLALPSAGHRDADLFDLDGRRGDATVSPVAQRQASGEARARAAS